MKSLLVCVLTIAVFMGSAFAEFDEAAFLLKYGYLKEKFDGNRNELPTPEEKQQAILQFQRFNGLPQTGMLDKTTAKKMIAPRCGVKDINGKLAEFRAVSKWPKNQLSWKIHKYSRTSKLSPAEQKRAIRRALKRWSDVSPLVFRETSGKPTIDISFERKRHGDGHAFDGRGMVLAHAFFPTNGDTHFDDDEKWINGKQGGTDLETVAAHEFGHALGLGHSNRPQSLMAPYYQVFDPNFKLHWDDIAGIQKLYGKKPTTGTRRTNRPTSTSPTTERRRTVTYAPPTGRGFCNHAYRQIDAAMRISGNDFVFVDNGAVIDGRNGHKMNIQSLFPGGPRNVHAAVYSKRTQKAYLFKGNKMWAYVPTQSGRFNLVRDFPKSINNRQIYNPESAMQFNHYGTERIFLIRSGYFFELMPYNDAIAPGRGYPTRNFFINIPNKIDAAISSDSEIHFIVQNKAYKMANNRRVVDKHGKSANLAFNKCRN